ncbi:hypothetical protein HK099_003298 [Clydaea vesicula]|uniref:Succinate dehydrogenase assembly factor 4, mitochondrial n=1 Tax=Clydaea vesicula TaxID=447962 RepID=A0AAD5XUB7_9FUNG|nr:hypothetical protein HK099_003298 [Clydaea vesicula]
MEDLIKSKQKELETSDYHPDAQSENTGPQFEGDKNPVTGEIGGPQGLEPTRYGDWERKGRGITERLLEGLLCKEEFKDCDDKVLER